MQISCPRCRATLLLPVEVIGRSACCPVCRTIFDAESKAESAAAAADVPGLSSPLIASTRLAEEEEELGPLPLVPGADDERALLRVAQAAFWVKLAAGFAVAASVTGAGILWYTAVLDQGNLAPDVRFRQLLRSAMVTGLCSLSVFAPLCGLFWVAGVRLGALRLHGIVQLGLLAGIAVGLLLGGMTLIEFSTMTQAIDRRSSPVPGMLAALTTSAAAALALVASFRAGWARREAISVGLHRRITDVPVSRVGRLDDAAPGSPSSRGRLDRARRAARGLRMTAVALAVSYPLSCLCIARHGQPWVPAEQFWAILVWGVGLVLFGVLIVGAQNLASLENHALARAGCFAALLTGIGFGVEFLRGMLSLEEAGPPENVLLDLARAGVALAAGVYSLHAFFSAWRVASDLEFRREFRR